MLNEIKTATITKKGQIAIPRNFRNLKGFNVGDKIVVLSFENRIELRPMSDLNELTKISEKVLAKDWNSKQEDKAWRNL